jgi:phage gp29-like protein
MTETARPQYGREIATTADGIDITRGFTGPLLTPYDSVLRARGNNDLLIYEQVLSDEEVKSGLNQRFGAVTQCEWDVEPGGKRAIDKQAAASLKECIQKTGWDNVTSKMLFGVFYGYAVAEVIYRPASNRIEFDAIKVRNRRRFRYGKDMDLRLLTHNDMLEGSPCEAPYFWDFSCGADNDDEPYGLGLAHWLYWPVLFKRNGLKFWLVFLEKFGMPTGVGKYDENATDTEKTKLLAATRAIQSDSGIIMPKNMELELLEAARSGTADYKTLHDTMNAAIQKVILGQTASTQGSPGKLGNDDLAGDVRKDIIKADADLVCESFNQGPGRWLTEWNFPGAAIPRVYRITEEPEDLDVLASRDEKVSKLGFKRTLASVTEKYGDGWIEKEPPPALDDPANPDTPPTAIAGPRFAEPRRAVLDLLRRHGHAAQFAEGEDLDPSVPMAQQLDKLIAPSGRRWVDQVRAIAATAGSLDELEQQLLAIAPDMSLDEYAEAFAQAMSAAHLAGNSDALTS